MSNFSYYYGTEAEQFNFYRLPKKLIQDKQFSHISSDAKILYGIMMDRMTLSLKNHWLDEENRIYIIYTVKDVMEEFNCSERKAISMMAELDTKSGMGLIEKKRQGLGKPNLIYIKNFNNREKTKTNQKKVEENLSKKNEENSLGEVGFFQTCKNLQDQTCKDVQNQTCRNLQDQTCKDVQNQTCKIVQDQACRNLQGSKTDKKDTESKENNKKYKKNSNINNTGVGQGTSRLFEPDSLPVKLTEKFIKACKADALATEKFPNTSDALDIWTVPIYQLLAAGYEEEQIILAMNYALQSDFWRPNIRTTQKFRNNFEQLYLKARAEVKTQIPNKENKFNNFRGRDYDMDSLERKLIQQ